MMWMARFCMASSSWVCACVRAQCHTGAQYSSTGLMTAIEKWRRSFDASPALLSCFRKYSLLEAFLVILEIWLAGSGKYQGKFSYQIQVKRSIK